VEEAFAVLESVGVPGLGGGFVDDTFSGFW